ncbi:MAG: DUF1501 domain-containing protein [Planctomycetota bacterium]|nr:DUF1501 domain-containing protein [Planctomycetota bacterium]
MNENLFDQRVRLPMSRRRVLQIGGIGAVGLTLPTLLQAEGVNRTASGISGLPRSCIFIHQFGGLSQLDSWDMKPEAPQEIRGPFSSIPTATPGFHLCELMPRLAQISDQYAVIRSMTHHMAEHRMANSMYLSGRTKPATDDPSFGAIVTRLRPSSSSLPGHVWLQKFGGGAAPPDHTYLTGGRLGMAYAPMLIGERHDDNPAAVDFRVRAFDTPTDVTSQRLQERRNVLQGLERHSPLAITSEFESQDLYQRRSFELLHGTAAKQAFDVDQEAASLRDRYGRNPLGQNLLLARRLIESGVRLVNVVAWTGLADDEKFVSVETWDMHGNADVGIFENGWNGLPFALPRTDQAVATLLDDLRERGLLDSTLVVLVGEFGRTPIIRKGARRIGRDHWPQCYSAMLAGGGVRGGVVYGESDRHAAFVKSNPVTLESFTATLFSAMGINPASRLSSDGFTDPASSGEPIPQLLG